LSKLGLTRQTCILGHKTRITLQKVKKKKKPLSLILNQQMLKDEIKKKKLIKKRKEKLKSTKLTH
jgi:hypothetical protein